MADSPWACDGPVSLPVPIDGETILIDMGTHVFTPDGLRLKATKSSISEVNANAYRPIDGDG